MAQSKKTSTAKKTGASKTTTKKSSSKSTKGSTAKKSSSPKKSKATEPIMPPSQPVKPIRREVSALVFLFLAVFMIISHFNDDGSFIVFFAELIKGLVGWGFWAYVPAFLVCTLILGFHKGRPVTLRVCCALFIPVLIAAIGHLFFYDETYTGADISYISGAFFEDGLLQYGGGAFGGLIAYGLGNALSLYGALPVLIVVLLVCIFICFKLDLSGAVDKARSRPHIKYDPSMYVVNTPIIDDDDFIEPVVVDKAAKNKMKEPAKVQRISRQEFSPMDIPLGDYEENELPLRDLRSKVTRIPAIESDAPAPAAKRPEIQSQSSQREFAPAREAPARTREKPQPVRDCGPVYEPVIDRRAEAASRRNEEEARRAGVDMDELRSTVDELMKPVAMSAEICDPPKKKMTRTELAAETQAVAEEISSGSETGDYEFPPINLLRTGASASGDSREEVLLNKERLEGALHSFGIPASIVSMTHGPTVTRYDIELEQGVKLARVTNLAGDLALALGVVNVRIAPIPDRISTVGIEVPNKLVSTVYLRDIIGSAKFSSAKSKLSFAIGKDIGGDCIVGNIAKLPHLLIAGTTGSGKSVCMNSLILSLLYKASPDEVRLIMIDPKMVELGIYNGIPHLYVPVVTDPKKAAGALQWSVVEMLKRYRLFAEMGVRDLENYNKLCLANGEDTMPQVVIVIDELADLMMVASKEVEESICRVAQMGRAAGMHLVIATQRPSADVITGLMKANIPSRIAFAVSSAMESRIILDQGGAEKLVGMGDMLFSPVGSGKPTRIQGAFVSDDERENVIQFIKEGSGVSENNTEIEEFMNKSFDEKNAAESGAKSSKDEGLAGEYDEMLPQAVDVVLEFKSCSVSLIQRRVKVGYARAARIVDQMEELGIVSASEGAKPRHVLIDMQGWYRLQVQLGLCSEDELPFLPDVQADMDEGYDEADSFDS